MRIPARRKPMRSGILRAQPHVWNRHRKFLRSHHCVVPGCLAEPIEVSHIRTAANAGIGIKPHDSSACPMCRDHHREYHQHGHHTFEKKYSVNLKALAVTFTKASPDNAMRASLRLVTPGEIEAAPLDETGVG